MSGSQIKRSAISGTVQNRIWARSAGRCMLCAAYLIDARSFFHSRSVAELAHNVGASDGPNSPRGASRLSEHERSQEGNILLLCHGCHRSIDDPEMQGFYTIEYLRDAKRTHERRVREVTDFATLRTAAVLKVTAAIRGTLAPASARQIAEALHPLHLTGFGEATRTGMHEVVLEDPEDAAWSWVRGAQQITRTVEAVKSAVAASDVDVIAVFALAPIPLLVHLGSQLDDKTETVLFRRARRDDALAWRWNPDGSTASAFEARVTRPAEPGAAPKDVLLTLDVTATVKIDQIPDTLRGLPTVALKIVDRVPGPNAIESRSDLYNFGVSWQDALSKVEENFPSAERVHVVSAVPAVAAVQMGRMHMRDAQPELHIYQRTPASGYVDVLVVR